MKRRKIALGIVKKVFFGTMVFGTALGLGCLIGGTISNSNYSTKRDEIINKSGYQSANIDFKVESQQDLAEKLGNGDLSRSEFLSEVENLQDLNIDEYMANTTAISSEDYANYVDYSEKIKDAENIAVAGCAVMGTCFIGSLIGSVTMGIMTDKMDAEAEKAKEEKEELAK